ncbi:MAG: hypothetical protein WD690_02840 [Vicinamibacterales bacterium]
MSLVEVTIILAVFAVLTAVAAPSIGGYMNDAAAAKAKADVEAIGSALSRMLVDTGEPWVLRNGNGGGPTVAPTRDAANRVDLLASNGATPAVAVTRLSGTTDWDDPVGIDEVQRLEYFLVENTPSGSSANGYRTAENVPGGFQSSDFGWRGAYLPGPIGPDPWGNRYAVNVEFLAKALGAGPSGNVNDVFVVSAGANRRLETRFDTDGVTAGGDDLIFVVSGGTR